MEKVIEVLDLEKEYIQKNSIFGVKKVFKALNKITFSVMKGEVFGILGPNGAGKTTTLEILETLREASAGSVSLLGLDINKSAGDIKKRIGVQLQESGYLHSITLSELLVLFASIYNKKIDPMQMLHFVGLEDKAEEVVKNLSGGQKQRFTIATSLVNDPEILFLDEPTTGLDPRARRDLWELIKGIQKRGVTIILTTHYMEEAEFLCDRVAIMDKGKLVTVSEPKNLINNLASTTQVSFLTQSILNDDFWKSIPQVLKVHTNNPKIILEISSLDCLGSIVDLLKRENVPFSSFTVKTATLEDVYLHLTGKEFEI